MYNSYNHLKLIFPTKNRLAVTWHKAECTGKSTCCRKYYTLCQTDSFYCQLCSLLSGLVGKVKGTRERLFCTYYNLLDWCFTTPSRFLLETCKNLYGSQVLSSWSVLDHCKIQHLGLSGRLTFPKAEDSVSLSINACLSVFANHKPNHTEAPYNLFSKSELNIRQRYSA